MQAQVISQEFTNPVAFHWNSNDRESKQSQTISRNCTFNTSPNPSTYTLQDNS